MTEVTAGFLLRVSLYDDFPLDVAPINNLLDDLTNQLETIKVELISNQYEEVVRAKNM